MPRRAALRLLATVLVGCSTVVAAVFLVMNLSLARQVGRIEQPTRITTSDYSVTTRPRSVVVITVSFPVDGETVRTKLGGGTHTTGDVVPRLHIVYDAADPARTMFAEDYDNGGNARTVAWIAGGVLLVDLIAVGWAVAAGFRSLVRRTPARPPGSP